MRSIFLEVEETKDVRAAEIDQERGVQRGLSIENTLSQSWEDLSLSEAPKERGTGGHSSRRSTDPTQPLTIGVGPFPSPRTSPTRRGWASRRSLSPITLRPSPLAPSLPSPC